MSADVSGGLSEQAMGNAAEAGRRAWAEGWRWFYDGSSKDKPESAKPTIADAVEAAVRSLLESGELVTKELHEARAKLAEAADLERRAPSRHDFEAYGLDDYIALVDAARDCLARLGSEAGE